MHSLWLSAKVLHHGTFNAQDMGRAPLRYRRAFAMGSTHAGGPSALPGGNFAAWGGAWWLLLARGTRTPKWPKQPQFYLTLSNYFSKKMA